MAINTTLTTKLDKKGKISRAIITGAVAYYVKLQKPAPIFEQRMVKNPTKTEWTADLVVSEDTADAYDEIFNKQSSKKVSKAEFMKKYKIENEADLPDPSAKKFFIIKVKHAAQDKDGNPIHEKMRPRIVEVVDGQPVDITFSKQLGAGSVVDVMLRVSQNDFGTFSYLSVIKGVDIVEYVGGGGRDEDEDEFLGGTLERQAIPEQRSGGSSDDADEDYEDGEYGDEGEDDDTY